MKARFTQRIASSDAAAAAEAAAAAAAVRGGPFVRSLTIPPMPFVLRIDCECEGRRRIAEAFCAELDNL